MKTPSTATPWLLLSLLIITIPPTANAWSTSTSSSHLTTRSTTQTQKQSLSSLHAAITSSSSTKKSKKKDSSWFPIHPADALSSNNDYNAIVKAAYVRQILVETEEMADLVLDLYVGGGRVNVNNDGGSSSSSLVIDDVESSSDLFDKLARQISTCQHTRDDGGQIGWIDNPHYKSMNGELMNQAVSDIMSSSVIDELFDRRVKGGDVFKLPIVSINDNSEQTIRGWHILRVDDLHLRPITTASSNTSTNSSSKNIVHKVRPKLKGSGVVPTSPKFTTNHNNPMNDNDDEADIIYTVPNAKYYKIVTTGCQMNVADSERIMGVLEDELRLSPLNDVDDNALSSLDTVDSNDNTKRSNNNKKKKNKKNTPDVLLLNTCTIRDHAEQKVYDALGPYAAMKRDGKAIAIVVAGCVAQQEGEALLRRFPEIDLVLGPQYIPWLSDLLVEVGKGSQLCMTESMLWSESGSAADGDAGRSKGWGSSRDKDGDWMVPIKRGHSVRGWVNVIYGCNEHCTYCVVPSVRGVEQSRSMEAILQECLQLASSGYKEIALLGQNIDAYGRDMTPRRTFADLLHYLNDNLPDGSISRIRYVTSHPRYFSDRVIDAVANLDKVCECFHMPFQAGDDEVLRGMRRGYTYDSYMTIIKKIRLKAPDASICGDVIVGFPGETEEAFQRTLDLMEEVKFDNLNTFAYSPRPNTEAANWDNQTPPDVQSDRLQRVQALAARHALERSQRYVGTVLEVLVEDRNPKNGNECMGRTRQGRQVFFEGSIDELKGELVLVEILEARTWSLVGSLSSI